MNLSLLFSFLYDIFADGIDVGDAEGFRVLIHVWA